MCVCVGMCVASHFYLMVQQNTGSCPNIDSRVCFPSLFFSPFLLFPFFLFFISFLSFFSLVLSLVAASIKANGANKKRENYRRDTGGDRCIHWLLVVSFSSFFPPPVLASGLYRAVERWRRLYLFLFSHPLHPLYTFLSFFPISSAKSYKARLGWTLLLFFPLRPRLILFVFFFSLVCSHSLARSLCI